MRILSGALRAQFYQGLLDHVLAGLADMGRNANGLVFSRRNRQAVLRALKKAGWNHVHQRKGIKLLAKEWKDWPIEVGYSGLWLHHGYDSLRIEPELESIRPYFKYVDINSVSAQTWRAPEVGPIQEAKAMEVVRRYKGDDLRLNLVKAGHTLCLTVFPQIRDKI